MRSLPETSDAVLRSSTGAYADGAFRALADRLHSVGVLSALDALNDHGGLAVVIHGLEQCREQRVASPVPLAEVLVDDELSRLRGGGRLAQRFTTSGSTSTPMTWPNRCAGGRAGSRPNSGIT